VGWGESVSVRIARIACCQEVDRWVEIDLDKDKIRCTSIATFLCEKISKKLFKAT
jgi:hypothetical protein